MSNPPAPSLRGEVFRLAWPVVLQNLLHTLMFYVDTAMIGGLGPEALAAMGVVGPIAHTITSILTALSVGAVAVVARAWGERNRAAQERDAAAALALGLGVGLPLAGAGILALPEAAGLFTVPGGTGVEAMARGYLFWEAASLVFYCVYMAAVGVLRACGQTRIPLWTALGANLVNVGLNVIFIYGHLGAPPMGVVGAALATAISLALEATVAAGILFTRFSPVRLDLSSFGRVDRRAMVRLFRVTAPAAVEPVILQSGFLVYTKAITLLGTLPLAAHRAALTVESLTFMPGYGFAVAGSALVGRFLGEKRPDRAQEALRESARMGVLLMGAIGILFLAVPETLVGFFLRSPQVEEARQLAAGVLRMAAFEQPFLGLSMALAGGLRGAGDTRSPVGVGFLGVWLVRVPLAWALAFPVGWGLYGIWLTMIADWAVRAAAFAALWRRGSWKAIKL